MVYTQSMSRAEAHLHLPRAKAGDKNCVSFRRLPTGKAEYASALHLACVTFAVQPAGLARFRETGQKNVHAYVRGELQSVTTDRWPSRLDLDWRRARYNPNENSTFIDVATGMPLTLAGEAVLIGTSVWWR